MARITPDELWKLVVTTGLSSRSAAAALRAEHDAAAGASGDAKAVAAWLVDRGVLTRWQAKRLATGDEGPFLHGDYRFLERHDHDGEAFEFTARHEPSGRIVCVVLMGKKPWRNATTRAAIVRRTTIATQAADPLFVRTWALEESDGRPFAVCEEVRGEPLADELARRGPLPLAEAGELALAVARALAELHAAGEVHGGLSLDALVREPPEAGGRLRLRQFPLATDPHGVPPRAPVAGDRELMVLGRRVAFVAPELAAGGECDARSDVYALGCVLHALITGAAPHWHGDPRDTLDRTAAAGPGPLDPARVPAALATLVEYLTARDPRDRYPDAAEAARAIATCFGFPQPELAAVPAPAAPEHPVVFDGAPEAGAAVKPAARGIDRDAARAAATEAARRRGRRLRFIGGVVAGAIVAATAALVVVMSMPPRRPLSVDPPPRVASRRAAPPRNSSRPAPRAVAPAPESIASPPADAAAAPAPAPAPPRQTIVDDRSLPWASPTEGPPPALAYLPAGSQLVVVARPADMLADDEGRLLVRALGPGVEAALAAVAAACGCAPGDIETLAAAWQTEGADELVVGWTARLVAGRTLPADEAFRARAWGAVAKSPREGETIHAGPRLSYWAPTSAEGRVLVAAPAARLGEIVEASAAADPPPLALPGDLERLAGVLDGARHLTVLGSPAYLLNRGRALLAGPLAPLAAGVEDLLGDAVQAAALSVHCGADFYVELDAIAALDLKPGEFATRLEEKIAAYPTAAKAFCAARDLHPYGRSIVIELPTMVRVLAANARGGPEGKVAVVNAYLPRHAGHNLALAAELALAQATGGGGAVAAAAAAPAGPAAPPGALGALGRKMTLVFAKDTLEKSIQMISEEIGVPMEIRGPDLQLEGITKNQSFALDEHDKPAAEILKAILAKANPDGKLVYVVRKQDGAESIEITTRAAVAKRGDVLPPAFQEAGDKPGRGTK
ncbi:MAG: protein kinase domain-containing protein [Planctomycetaceae bacterium]